MTVKLPISLPDIVSTRPVGNTNNQIVIDLHVPVGLAHFTGHFPGLPILPGVVQIDWAVRYATEYFVLSGHFSALENIKFLALVLPSTNLELTLTLDKERTRIDFLFADGQRRFSSGRIVFSEAT